jgi:uncharacterized protein DUF3175
MRRPSKPKRAPARKASGEVRAQRSRRIAKPAQPRARTPARTSSERTPQRWSAAVTHGSNALDLEPDVFKKSSPRAVAQSLKRSAERSRRRKTEPYRSAMSMLTFYINRAGRNLPKARLQVLERAKGELRKAFGRS